MKCESQSPNEAKSKRIHDNANPHERRRNEIRFSVYFVFYFFVSFFFVFGLRHRQSERKQIVAVVGFDSISFDRRTKKKEKRENEEEKNWMKTNYLFVWVKILIQFLRQLLSFCLKCLHLGDQFTLDVLQFTWTSYVDRCRHARFTEPPETERVRSHTHTCTHKTSGKTRFTI